MARKPLKLVALMIIILTLLVACTTDKGEKDDFQERLNERDMKISELEDKIKELESSQTNDSPKLNNLVARVLDVLEAIRTKDMDKLSSYIDPNKGVRFSPYPSVDKERDKVFTREEIKNILTNNDVFQWGSYDGSGNPINLNFVDYYERFIYDADFSNPDIIGNNVVIASGNAVENVKEVYPHGQFVEFYIKGDNPDFGDSAWRSLKLVFEEDKNNWYLVGIIHGEWTI